MVFNQNLWLRGKLTGTLASDLAVGSSAYLYENGSPVEYLVVHQGNPDANLYDANCAGTWLLRKDIYTNNPWHSSNGNSYKDSTIHSYLNSTFLSLFDRKTQSSIKQVKIPHVNGKGGSEVASGPNGLSTKVFLLGGYEVGFTQNTNPTFPVDGACLAYFLGTAATDSKRVGYLDGVNTNWWLRSHLASNSVSAWVINVNGNAHYDYCSAPYGIRPALILPYNAVFDTDTLILKGVA